MNESTAVMQVGVSLGTVTAAGPFRRLTGATRAGHSAPRREQAEASKNQADTEFHRVHTEFHREVSIGAPREVSRRICARSAINVYSVKLCVHSVKLCVRLISCLITMPRHSQAARATHAVTPAAVRISDDAVYPEWNNATGPRRHLEVVIVGRHHG